MLETLRGDGLDDPDGRGPPSPPGVLGKYSVFKALAA
jgi:hypothetical protein